MNGSLSHLVEKDGALPDDAGGARLLVLAAAEGDSVVHLALLVQDDLLHLHQSDPLLPHLVALVRHPQPGLDVLQTRSIMLASIIH